MTVSLTCSLRRSGHTQQLQLRLRVTSLEPRMTPMSRSCSDSGDEATKSCDIEKERPKTALASARVSGLLRLPPSQASSSQARSPSSPNSIHSYSCLHQVLQKQLLKLKGTQQRVVKCKPRPEHCTTASTRWNRSKSHERHQHISYS